MKVWAIITQRGMSSGKWCIIEVNEYADPLVVRSPFDSKAEAIAQEDVICRTYDRELQIIEDELNGGDQK